MNAEVVTAGAVYTVWGLSLLLGLVVIVVVGVLLALILRTVRQIDEGASVIWTTGTHIANNTVHIPLLAQTNLLLGQILQRAGGIDQATAAVEAHAADCPGCPQCVLGRAGSLP